MERDDLNRAIGELATALNYRLLSLAMAGDGMRTLTSIGHRPEAISAAGGNELKAQLLIGLVNRLEELVRGGLSLKASLDALRHEGWMKRFDNLDMQE